MWGLEEIMDTSQITTMMLTTCSECGGPHFKNVDYEDDICGLCHLKKDLNYNGD